MPAVGKTTVGNLIAGQLNFQFLDSDDLIIHEEKKTLSQIIAQKGLSKFLHIEEARILSIDCQQHVIATGGSVVYKKKAMTHLARISTIVYLYIDCDALTTRLSNLTDRGVAITPGKSIEDLYKERTPLYDAWCDIKIDCQSMTAKAVSKKVMAYLF